MNFPQPEHGSGSVDGPAAFTGPPSRRGDRGERGGDPREAVVEARRSVTTSGGEEAKPVRSPASREEHAP